MSVAPAIGQAWIPRLLTVSGERLDKREEKRRDYILSEVSYGRFARSIKIPDGLQSEQIVATYDQGVLRLEMALPKAMEARKVPVQGVAAAENQAGSKTPRKAA